MRQSFWIGLDRQAFVRAINARQKQRRADDIAVRAFVRRRGIKRIPMVEAEPTATRAGLLSSPSGHGRTA